MVRHFVRRKHTLGLALILWTFFAWSNRLKNILGDQTEAQTMQLVIALAFLLLAASSLLVILTKKVTGFTTWLLPALALFGIIRWLYRTPVVLFGGESAAFKIVHVLLAIITIVLSVGVLRQQKPWNSQYSN